ncbi:Hsp20/alpha crystallin family protein [Cupriavidus agavae]|uniref:HSP20 family protein n=1 Tax=Cupriavidus agavae TaxID=1001822 RepID=A0A4Q7RP57_9BURK|nr:Hsp20/alpha crystallin family protein [Cupriavidus agavae]RZT35465.1 HSP20 family protein [Cupriavidus agavae]
MSDFFFGTDLFSEFDRMQRQLSSLTGGLPSSLRAARAGTFPLLNVGATDDSIEIVVFAPGLDSDAFDVSIDKGMLTIAGERQPMHGAAGVSQSDEPTRVYAQERFAGKFRRVIELPSNADADNVKARYSNGCLAIIIGKREASRPKAIAVQ